MFCRVLSVLMLCGLVNAVQAQTPDYDYVQFAYMPHSELDFAAADGDGFSIAASWLFKESVNLYLRRDYVDYKGARSHHRFLGLGWRFPIAARLDGIAGVEVGRISLSAPNEGRDEFNARRAFVGLGGVLGRSWEVSARYHRDHDYLGRFDGFFYAMEVAYRLTRNWSTVLELESGHYRNLRSRPGDPERDDVLLGLRYSF